MSSKKYQESLSVLYPLLILSIVATSMLSIRIIASGSLRYWFLTWNLFLAWVPLLLSFWLIKLLRNYRWSSWQAILVTLSWIFFLPNSFYIVTDFIHIHDTKEVSILFDVVIISIFSFTGFLLGFVSLAAVHKELNTRFKKDLATKIILAVILSSSFAIYLGRYLRWNSWDVVSNPFGLIYDITGRFVSPSDYPSTFATTAMFFVMISTFYFCTRLFIKSTKDLVK